MIGPEDITKDNVWEYVKQENQAILDNALAILSKPIEASGIENIARLALLSVDEEAKHMLYIEAEESGIDLSPPMIRALEDLGFSQLFWRREYPRLRDH